MRVIVLARMPEGKTRPVLVLSREAVLPHLTAITVAPITSRIRGLRTEVPVGPANGIDHDAVINCDAITTVPSTLLGRRVGLLLQSQEDTLAEAIVAAFDLQL